MATIYSFSIVRSSTPEFAERVPYCSAILENESGERFAALLDGYTDGMDVQVGQEVRETGTSPDGKALYAL